MVVFQLEIIQPKRLRGPRLDKLLVPAAVTIALLFVLQLVVFVVVNTGNDVSNGAVIVQAVVFLVMFVVFLVFFLYVVTRLALVIHRSPQKLANKLVGPLTLATCAVLGSMFAFAAAGIVLADLTYNTALFVLLEVFSDLSTLFCCFGIGEQKKEKMLSLISLAFFSSGDSGESSQHACSHRVSGWKADEKTDCCATRAKRVQVARKVSKVAVNLKFRGHNSLVQ